MAWVVPTLHPASLMRDQTMQFAVKGDFAKLARIQREGVTIVPPDWVEWQLFPALHDVEMYFEGLAILAEKMGGPISFDFEATLNREVVCLGLWSCHEPTEHRGLCVPFLQQGGSRYWSPRDELRVLKLCTDFFTDARIGKIGQNCSGYDCGVPPFNERSLLKVAWGVDIAGLVGDTMVAHALTWPELRHSLALQSSICTDLGPYKEEVWDDSDDAEDDGENEWARVLDRPDRDFRIYNLRDAFAQAVIWNISVEVMA